VIVGDDDSHVGHVLWRSGMETETRVP
jgi:hypothetical protein